MLEWINNKYGTHLTNEDLVQIKNFTLSNLPSTNDEKILAMSIVVYRYRNNLFHGGKNFMELHEQHENFRIANIFLQTFLNT